jgi:MinD superfamily P-loop ATPase
MRIAIASGKGGTGKTTIATNLAASLSEQAKNVAYVDCDVEEPNGHIFLEPEIEKTSPVEIMVPHIDSSICSLCGECADVCRYNALAVLGNKVLVFESLCHGCGACSVLCPEKAVTEKPRTIGRIDIGMARGMRYYAGSLTVGEALAPPVTRALKKAIDGDGVIILDSPPGTSCPVIEAVRGADYVVLVTVPTPFGLHDLELAQSMLNRMQIPFGVIINQCDIGDRKVFEFCEKNDISVLLELPFERTTAEAYSRGELAIHRNGGFAANMYNLFQVIEKTVNDNGTDNSKR